MPIYNRLDASRRKKDDLFYIAVSSYIPVGNMDKFVRTGATIVLAVKERHFLIGAFLI